MVRLYINLILVIEVLIILKKIISADVIDYKYNENYIIVKQVPNEKILIQEIEDNLAISLDFYGKKNQKIILEIDTNANKLGNRTQIKSIVGSN